MKKSHNISIISLSVIILLALTSFLTACTSTTAQAPVYNLWHQPISISGRYTVKPHDTLYSIAWNFGLDYRQLANLNQLHTPYTILPGQVLILKSQKNNTKPSHQPKTIPHKRSTRINTADNNKPIKHWIWPARGHISATFSKQADGNKGINIQGHTGEPIMATAAGKVVYSGDGVRGYGNLIIIKHNNNYLSAYAYNQQLLVKQGMRVHAGQRIALMGKNNSGQALLHFEIRHNGLPTNPMYFLTK